MSEQLGISEMVSGVVYGQPQRKDNRRRIVKNRRTRAPMLIKNAEALAYEAEFLRQIKPGQKAGFDFPVVVTLKMYYQSNRSDLSPELIFDLLQKAGVIKNDRLIVKATLEKGIDKELPRVVWAVQRARFWTR